MSEPCCDAIQPIAHGNAEMQLGLFGHIPGLLLGGHVNGTSAAGWGLQQQQRCWCWCCCNTLPGEAAREL